MILKKPYAFFIKYFKLIHLIMAVVMGFLLYRTNLILSFLTNYVNEMPIITGSELTNDLFSFAMMIVPFVIVVASIIILSVMYVKKKPFVMYIFNIIFYIGLIILYSYASNMIGQMELKILDIRVVRVLRDIISLVFILQIVFSIIMVVRATGFDIKKFDFGQDLEELDINEEDNEEFEVDVEFDVNKFKRKWKKNIRHLKYFYLENKFAMRTVLAILLVTTGFVFYLNAFILNKSYKINNVFSTSDLTMSVKNAYLLETNHKGIKVSNKNNSLIALKVNVKRNTTKEVKLNQPRFELNVGGRTFYPQTKYRDLVIDLGIVYDNQVIKKEMTSYVFIYEVPNSYLDKSVKFNYVDSFKLTVGSLNPINTTVKLDVRDLKESKATENFKLTQNINFKKTTLNNVDFKVNSFEISNEFSYNYKKCVTATECYDLVEHIVPNPLNLKSKVLLKLNASFVKDATNDLKYLNSAYDLISYFGKVCYMLDGKEICTNDISLVKPIRDNTTNLYYIEVDSEILKSDKVNIQFDIRDYKYIYNLK